MNDKAQRYAECLSWVLGYAKASQWSPECRVLLDEMRQRFSAEAKEPVYDTESGRCRRLDVHRNQCTQHSGHSGDHSFWIPSEATKAVA